FRSRISSSSGERSARPPRSSRFTRKRRRLEGMSKVKRTALVTGGMGGLGEAIARALYDAGHRVLVTHVRDGQTAAAWLEREKANGYAFQSYQVDVADFDSCAEMA